MIEKVKRWLPWAVLFIVLAAIPKLFGIYYMNFFITFAVFAVFSVSLNLLLGYTGLLSFGHAMYFGAGGYGVIWVEATSVLPDARANPRQLWITRDTVPAFRARVRLLFRCQRAELPAVLLH